MSHNSKVCFNLGNGFDHINWGIFGSVLRRPNSFELESIVCLTQNPTYQIPQRSSLSHTIPCSTSPKLSSLPTLLTEPHSPLIGLLRTHTEISRELEEITHKYTSRWHSLHMTVMPGVL